MPLILERNHVLDVYSGAAMKQWLIPTFCTENLTTTEAILSAALEYSQKIGQPNLPVTLAITNQYSHRSQSVNYTHTKQWDIGLKHFMADIHVLTSEGSPFEKLDVMIHLDHVQWDTDEALLQYDMNPFSMIMYDASTLPLDQNIKKTAEFVEKHKNEIVIEGACDEIMDAGGSSVSNLTTPENAERYLRETGVDFIVANLGTEHRASAAELKYHDDLARAISKLTGPKLVLHGTSSVKKEQIKNLFSDGISKVNIWTTLERDSTPFLFEEMLSNASRIIGSQKTSELINKGLLGDAVEKDEKPSLSYYTTLYRQEIIFLKMKEIVSEYLKLWYV